MLRVLSDFVFSQAMRLFSFDFRLCLRGLRLVPKQLAFLPHFQARKTNPNLNFLVWIFSGGVGVFHTKGWGPKSSVCPSKPGKSNFFRGISRDFAGISRNCPKSLRKKEFGFNFRSLHFCTVHSTVTDQPHATPLPLVQPHSTLCKSNCVRSVACPPLFT